MKNLSLALMLLTTLCFNLAPAQAVNKQIKVGTNNELSSQDNTIINQQYNYRCYVMPWGAILCK